MSAGRARLRGGAADVRAGDSLDGGRAVDDPWTDGGRNPDEAVTGREKRNGPGGRGRSLVSDKLVGRASIIPGGTTFRQGG